MGKTKQAKEKKFDRNVEISAPILDPEIIKQIHSPPKGQRLDIKHGGFKALLSDLNSQDSTDELTPLNDNHVPSYIGISCAVSGYSNYSSYSKRSSSPQPQQLADLKTTISNVNASPNRSRTTSPITRQKNIQQEVHHITIDRNNIHSADDERKELTEKLTASATERRRSPSPITPTEDDRHHGAYVGARYCPLPPPSKLVNKHIPLLGIDDDKNPDEIVEDNENKVQHKIASLYGDDFVEDWRESMTHKSKRELTDDQVLAEQQQENYKNPKDLVTLKPTPVNNQNVCNEKAPIADLPTPNVKVLASVEKQFLNKLLTDENPPMPSQSPTSSPIHMTQTSSAKTTTITTSSKFDSPSPTQSPIKEIEDSQNIKPTRQQQSQPSTPVQQQTDSPVASKSPSPELNQQEEQQHLDYHNQGEEIDDQRVAPMSPDSGKSQSFGEEELLVEPQISSPQMMESKEEHIEYEIRAQSPLDNESSPIKILSQHDASVSGEESGTFQPVEKEKEEEEEQSTFVIEETSWQRVSSPEKVKEPDVEDLVNFSPSPEPLVEQQQHHQEEENQEQAQEEESQNGFTKEVENEFEAELEQQQQQVVQAEEEKPNNIIDDTVVLETEQVFNQEESLIPIDTDTTTSDTINKGGQYYLNLLDKEKSFILEQIERAQDILKNKESELDEETIGRIHSAIGKSNLLITKKCNQFKGLCESNFNSGNNLGEQKEQFAVLNDDLAGFWDMLSIQISDIKRSFENLWDNVALKEKDDN